MKKAWVLSYPLSGRRRLWSDWADAQADLSLRSAHGHFVDFVMSRLIWAGSAVCYHCILKTTSREWCSVNMGSLLSLEARHSRIWSTSKVRLMILWRRSYLSILKSFQHKVWHGANLHQSKIISKGKPLQCYKIQWPHKNCALHCKDRINWAATWQNQQNDCAPSEDSDHDFMVFTVDIISIENATLSRTSLSGYRYVKMLCNMGSYDFNGMALSTE